MISDGGSLKKLLSAIVQEKRVGNLSVARDLCVRLFQKLSHSYSNQLCGIAPNARQGNYEKAMQHALLATSLAWGSPEFQNELGNVYLELGNNQRALARYSRAHILNSQSAETYCNLGIAYCRIGRTDEAIGYLRKAAELNPGLARAFECLALIFESRKEYAEAGSFFAKVIELEMQNPSLSREMVQYLDGTFPNSQSVDL